MDVPVCSGFPIHSLTHPPPLFRFQHANTPTRKPGMGPETPPATSTASVNADWKPVRDRDTVVYNSDDEEQLSQMLEAGGYPGGAISPLLSSYAVVVIVGVVELFFGS